MEANERIQGHVDDMLKVVLDNTRIIDGEQKASANGVELLLAALIAVPSDIRETVVHRFESQLKKVIEDGSKDTDI